MSAPKDTTTTGKEHLKGLLQLLWNLLPFIAGCLAGGLLMSWIFDERS
jgi:hypothetical protein